MHKRKLAGLMAASLLFSGGVSVAQARDAGPSAAQWLNELYANTRMNCGDWSRPAYFCSGVILRATAPSTAFQFYSISPQSLANGRVSMSYLRRDAKFASFYAGRSSGFVLDNRGFDGRRTASPLKVRCFFPIDGASLRRTEGGCGDYDQTVAVEQTCQQKGIWTAEQWLDLYLSDSRYPQGAQCGFAMRDDDPGRARQFYQGIRATGLLAGISVFVANDSQENELIVVPWDPASPASIPVVASFYTDAAGLRGARLNQIQWYQATGRVLPAIGLKMPASAQQDARFDYAWKDQAIQPLHQASSCPRYVERANWVMHRDAESAKQIPSLEVVPTACGKSVGTQERNNFFNELVSAHYLSPEWINNPDNPQDNIQSMRRQLDCHMKTGQGKATWSLEPSRPDTKIGTAIALDCDAPLP